MMSQKTSALGSFFLIVMFILAFSSIFVFAQSQEVNTQHYGYIGKSGPYTRVVGPSVVYIKVEGIIDTAMADYVKSAIKYAEEHNAVLVILLNTPGGYLDSAQDIVIAMDSATVPIVGFVYKGWAESAGTLILLSTDIAAMAPGTQIGSLQPVMYNPTTGSYEPVNESKIINAIVEFLKIHAGSKGRNETELARFVTHNDNLDPQTALKYHVINFIADNLQDLIREINGSRVRLPSDNSTVLIRLDGSMYYYSPSFRNSLLHALSDPLLSGLLLSLGMLIILFTLAAGHPALAAIGALLLFLGLAGSGFNPNYTALFLIILGSILLFIEIHTPGFGVIGGTGIVMLILGIALLPVASGGMAFSIAYARGLLKGLYATGAVIGGFGAYAVYRIIQVRRRPSTLWTLEGARGKALDRIEPGKPGFVIVEGEYWKAESDEIIEPGEEVIVIKKEGRVLKVIKAKRGS